MTVHVRRIPIWFAAAVLLSFAAQCSVGGPSSDLDADGVAANNRGVAFMGRFNYEEALVVFEDLAERYPENPDVLVNLAIATLNRQQEGDEATAVAIFKKVLELDPSNLRAQYGSGILELHAGNAEAALTNFLAVTEGDPKDADAAYHVGQCYMQMQEFEEALTWFERAIDSDPFLRSAYYRAFQATQRLRDRDRAKAYIEHFQSLENNPQARLVEFKYTKMGARAEVDVIGSTSSVAPKPDGPIFADARPLAGDLSGWRSSAQTPPAANMTACDIDADGAVDLFFAGGLTVGEKTGNAVMMAGGGSFNLVADHPLAAVDGVNTALWGDIDNDGLTDVYLCRRGPNQLWRQLEGGTWQDITASTGTDGGDGDTVDGALVDADHDGDLDLFLINSNTDNLLLNNNRDGSFRELATDAGLTGGGRPSRSIVVTDLDADLDADLIIINEEAPHEVYLNDLLWQYRSADGWNAFTRSEISAAVAGDVDADGQIEIYTLDPSGSLNTWIPDESGKWQATAITSVAPSTSRSSQRLALSDVDGDMVLDLVTSNGSGWSVHSTTDGASLYAAPDEISIWTLAALETDRGPSLVASTADGDAKVWAPGPGRFPFVSLALSGKEDVGASMRTNASGIGNRMAVRAGTRWTVTSTFRADSGPGQSLQPVQLGLGGAPRIDFVSIDWADGVLQTEMDLEPGPTILVTETQRQLSSCPVLFVWDGVKYAFVTDLLGVGGMGYALGPGEYNVPRPWENILLPDGSIAPRDGRFLIKLGEPMEEITYLDTARLVAYDLPPGWLMTLDERMSIFGPEPTGKPVFARHVVAPVRATTKDGEDVTAAIAAADLEAAPVGALDLRFIGRLEGDQVLTIEFDEDLDGLGEDLVLVADGWVEYPYSQTNFAAWQAGADFRAPTLEARGDDGRWQVIYEQFGYPAGMPRQMSLPLPPLPKGTRALRLTTNQEIYWDRLLVAVAEDNVEIERHELAMTAARVEMPGFALRTTGPQRLPDYDWTRRAPLWDTRFQVGYYTRFGDALELVQALDDAVAIFGPGEALHLEFEEPATAPRAGWTRVYVLETEGWCKDMDLFTRDGKTVGPMPTAGRDPTTTKQLHEKYNTRYVTSSG